jgi:hypothetical protein
MLRCMSLSLLVVMVIGSAARAEIVPKSAEEMQKMATHVVVGDVRGVFTSQSRSGQYEKTHYVAEVLVRKLEKGEGPSEGKLIYVRYWTQHWAGPGLPPPGTAGHRGLPATGDTVRAYLVNKGYDGGGQVTDGGYNVVFADGLVVQKHAKTR